jgi:AcrR family transcriptional regulator
MAKRSQTTAAARPPLTRERVLQAALGLADAGGIDALSMRKLAQELGVEAMSLYNHVANKEDILDGILDLVALEFDAPSPDTDWKTALRRSSISAHEAHGRHPWAASIWMKPRKPSAPQMAYADAILRTLRQAGFSEHLTYHGYHSIVIHVLGYRLHEQNFAHTRDELKELAAAFLRDFPADEYPDLAEHIRQHVEPDEDHQGAFEFGLDLVLDGLERLRDAENAVAGSAAAP